MRRRREMGSEEPWSRLEGKVVMVTGASSGIGRDLCVDLAKAGCLIVASARRTDLLRSLCEEVRALTVEEPGRIAAVRLDISQDGDTIDAAVQAAWEVFGRIDVLVNNAGVRGAVIVLCLQRSLCLSFLVELSSRGLVGHANGENHEPFSGVVECQVSESLIFIIIRHRLLILSWIMLGCL